VNALRRADHLITASGWRSAAMGKPMLLALLSGVFA
jgi:hypothetical protein